MASKTDFNGNITTYTYDLPRNLETSRTEAKHLRFGAEAAGLTLHGALHLGKDALDNLTQVKDPKVLETAYTYNALGDLLVLDSPDTGITRYAYDSAGNRVSQLDAKGVEVFYGYDALNRLSAIDYADDTLDVSFGYDEGVKGIGRLTAMSDGSGTTSYQYDLRGNIIEKQTTRDGLSLTRPD